MQQFAFVARDASGAMAQGTVAAASAADAARMLRSEGKYPVRVAPAVAKAAAAAGSVPGIHFRERFRSEDIIYFTSQLMVMVETGVSLADALRSCRGPKLSPAFARSLDKVIEDVEGGSRFSVAMASHPRVFSPLLVSLVRASEASGAMAAMLLRANEYLVAQRDLAKKIRGAVTYPIAMLLFACGVTVFLMTFVLPKFAAIYAGKETALPKATRILLSLSEQIRSAWPYALGVLLMAAGTLAWHFRTSRGRRHLDWIKLHVPLIGRMFHRAYLARGLRTLGTMINSGVTMLEAVELTRAACGNTLYEELWSGVHDEIQHGKQISDVLDGHPYVPPSIVQMIRAGERSGKLGPVLERVSTYCESELAVAVKSATAMLEPIIITVLGGVIGGLVIAMLLPIFTISRAFRPGG
jgi:type IV pilus assembly protein PilC